MIKSLLLRLGKLMTATKLYRGLNGWAPAALATGTRLREPNAS